MQIVDDVIHCPGGMVRHARSRPGYGVYLIQLEVARGLLDSARRDRADLVHISVDQRMLTEQVDDSRNSLRVIEYRFDGLFRENRGTVGSADPKALRDVSGEFAPVQRMGLATDRDALPQLAEVGVAQLFVKLGLPAKDDLQEFFTGGFEVRKEAHFFKDGQSEILGFVNYEDACLPVAITLKQPLIQLHEQVAFVARLARYAEVRHHEIEELGCVELGMKDVSRRDTLLVEPVEQAVEQRRFAGAHFAGQQQKTLAAAYAIGETSESLVDLRREVKKARIGIRVKGTLAQSEEAFVHTSPLTSRDGLRVRERGFLLVRRAVSKGTYRRDKYESWNLKEGVDVFLRSKSSIERLPNQRDSETGGDARSKPA